jgi:transporter family-2 protein
VTGPRVFAAGIAVAAVVVSVSDRLGSADFTTAAIAAIGLAVVGGVGVAFQAAANGRIAQTSGQPVVGAGVNFMVGVTILAIAVVTVTGPTRNGFLGDTPSPAWLYVGALFGLLVVIVSAWAVKYLGILVFSLIGVSGQLCGSVVIDLVSPTGAFTVTWALVAGSVLTLVAVVIGSGWRPWRGREPQPPLSGGG